MKFWRGAVMISVVLSAGSVFGTMDPVWMYGDSVNLIYTYFRYCDTARDLDLMCNEYPPDTGVTWDGTQYINLDYQFSSDSFFIKNQYDTTIILCRDLRPGFAGFKTAWDYGMTGFPVARYKYIVLAHKGPNQNHRVAVWFWYNNGGCGVPSYKEHIGTFSASDTWREDTLVIPESVQNKPDYDKNTFKYYEMVFIINNIDPNDTTSGPPGGLKIDNIRLVGCNPIDTSPNPQEVIEGEQATFYVWTSRADSADILTFQWKKDGVSISGANDTTYTVASAAPVLPVIQTQPQSQTADEGAPVTFTVTATAVSGVYTVAVTVSSTNLTFTSHGAALTVNTASYPSLSYQWRKDGNPISGATSSTFTIASTKPADAGNYTVVVTNSLGSVASNAAALTVNEKEEDKKCGCGSGTGTALIPPLIFKAMAHRKRKKRTLRFDGGRDCY
jgi:hypothetical protein